MVHANLLHFVLVTFLLAAASPPAAASDVDGVPLPRDIRVETITEAESNARWLGAWVGSWDGILKHVLVVESVQADGSARVVYAIGDMPRFGIKREWSRHVAMIRGSRLTISDTGFSASYDLNDQGGLSASYARGKSVSHSAMTKADLTAITQPGAVIPWTRGKSEFLQTDLIESGQPVKLEVVMFYPTGSGPFPLAVFNHGSTGRGTDPALFRDTWFDLHLADFLNDRGWLVAFPQRRGRGKSDGLYDEGFSADRAKGYTCEVAVSLAGADRALEDIGAAMVALRRRPDVAPVRALIGGQSRGGVLSVAYAGMHPDQISGVINFVGGWMGTGCDTAARLNGSLFRRGARYDRPMLWLYGHHDPFYDIEHSRNNFAEFENSGGKGTFLEFDVPGGYGHGVIGSPALWRGPVADYLSSLPDDGKN